MAELARRICEHGNRAVLSAMLASVCRDVGKLTAARSFDSRESAANIYGVVY